VDRAARPGGAHPDEAEVDSRTLFALPAALTPSVSWLELIVRGVVIYVGLIVALRLFGKREVGQFTLYDLVFILLVANALQPAITGPDNSLTGGLILIVALVGANFVVGRLDRFPRLHRLFSPGPAVIIRGGKFESPALAREGVTEDECEMAIREHGLEGVKDVELGVLEADGSISIVPTGSEVHRTKRRVRFIRRSG
jgi:uncharacterized membrane protein YcaP (DUF421 family)